MQFRERQSHVSGNRQTLSSTSGDTRDSRIVLFVWLAFLLVPGYLEISGLRVDAYRFLIIFMLAPLTVYSLNAARLKINFIDLLIIFYSFWSLVALLANHGTPRLPYAAMISVEIVSGYFAGRVLVQSLVDFRAFLSVGTWILALLLPFAVFELLTERMLLSEFVGLFINSTEKSFLTRLGMSRVQVVFPHAILFGLFCSLFFANLYFLRGSTGRRFFGPLLAGLMAAMSLSSAPLLSIGVQGVLVIWDWIFRGRWKLLIILSAICYVLVDLASNRTPLIILIETLTFNPLTGWTRIHIWNHGIASALSHPVFGIGLNDWARPHWLTSSVDNFWLFTAMRYGFPAVIALAAAVALLAYRIIRAPLVSKDYGVTRKGYLISLFGLVFTLATVHVWGASFVFIMFYIGAGVFLAELREVAAAESDLADAPSPRHKPHTRFSPDHRPYVRRSRLS